MAFYYVDNAYYAALENLEDGNEAVLGRDLAVNPYKLWDKKTFRSRRSKAANLKSLKNLCLKSVADNMDSIWCKDYVENWSGQNLAFLLGPFELLAGQCIYDLMNELRGRNLLHFRYLPILITGNLQKLNLKNLKNINKILNSIKFRCQNNLRILNLENCTGMTESVLASTLKSLKKLEQLNLRGTNVSDEILNTISQCTFPLSCLQLSDNDQVTDEGVKKLCTEHLARHLAYLSLDFTGVSTKGLNLLLGSLPNLQVLEHTSVADAILVWYERFPKKPLKLRQLKVNPANYIVEELHYLTVSCPCLSDLSFMPSDICDPDAILPFLDVKELSSFVSDNSIVPESSWFLHLGLSLTKLEITGSGGVHPIDVSVIGQCCPNLHTLSILNINLIERKDVNTSFCKLQFVCLQNKTLCNNINETLTMIFKKALNLTIIELYLFQILDGFFESICCESLENSKILSNLMSVSFVKCENVTNKSLNCLICTAPYLQKIHFHKNANSYYIDNFIAQNKLDIEVFCDKSIEDDE